jgi:hypothetical protein
MNDEICFINLSTEASFPVCHQGQQPSPVNGTCTHLEQRRDSICRDRSICVGDQVLHIQVASRDGSRLRLSELVEGFDSGEFENCLGRGQEQLKNYTEKFSFKS